ncbi:MAG TPA: SDR family NAD(P)-dependent oxidoreductase [Acidimicrobiales bacterium]|nr:SDR family NAD(P)-dependent oxidoreductase [Acidimicrobiales bacterium]
MQDLTQRVAVITGGGSGIGRATCMALAQQGAYVLVTDLDAGRATAVAQEISDAGGVADGVRCDVSSDADVAAARDAALDRFGRVDIVMNNVGVLVLGTPEAIPASAWQRLLDINVASIGRSLSVFLPGLLEQGSGHIVNTASTAGLFAYSYERLPYSASKGAVVALSEALALYTRPRGVGVTVLCPGPVATNIIEQVTAFGEPPKMHTPGLALLDPAVVGAQVCDAIRRDIFFLPTHSEVHDILVRRAQDPEGFVAAQVESLWAQDHA